MQRDVFRAIVPTAIFVAVLIGVVVAVIVFGREFMGGR
jgi:hypothetical protein